MAWKWFQHPWALETASMIACFVQFAAMIVVCVLFNGKAIFDGPVITLNTIVSILSTGSKASMLTAVASCIGQANWSLFAGSPRRLYDFEMVADASRGPLGSLQLLWSTTFKGGMVVRIGAVITVLSIVMDPFAQQLIQLDQTTLMEPGGSFPRALRYDQGVQFQNVTMENSVPTAHGVISSSDPAMKAALFFGLTADTSQIQQQAPYSCPSNYCRFPNIKSMAICSKCSNIDSSIKNTTMKMGVTYVGWVGDYLPEAPPPGPWNATRLELPNGLYMQAVDGTSNEILAYLTMMGTSNASRTITMENLDTLIWSQSILKVNNASTTAGTAWPNLEVHATECALYYCVQDYSLQVMNGTLTGTSKVMEDYKRNPNSWQLEIPENFSNKKIALPNEEFHSSLGFHPTFSWFPRTDLEFSTGLDGTERFTLSQTAVDGISSLAQTTFSSCRPDKNCSSVVEDWAPPTGFLDPGAHAPQAANLFWQSGNLEGLFTNLAMSMSNALRLGSMQSTSAGVQNSSSLGEVYIPVTLYRIKWAWVSLHAAIQVAAIVFFILTRLDRRASGDVPVWKTSQLAVLSKGKLVSDVLRNAKTLNQLNERAKEVPVILIEGEEEHPLIKVQPASGQNVEHYTNKIDR